MLLQVAETYTAHHHKDKAATLHVVPEYEDNEDIPASVSGTSDSNSTLPIPRARQAFIPRGSSDGDPPLAGASQQTHLQLPSPTAASALYGSLPKWGGETPAPSAVHPESCPCSREPTLMCLSLWGCSSRREHAWFGCVSWEQLSERESMVLIPHSQKAAQVWMVHHAIHARASMVFNFSCLNVCRALSAPLWALSTRVQPQRHRRATQQRQAVQ